METSEETIHQWLLRILSQYSLEPKDGKLISYCLGHKPTEEISLKSEDSVTSILITSGHEIDRELMEKVIAAECLHQLAEQLKANSTD